MEEVTELVLPGTVVLSVPSQGVDMVFANSSEFESWAHQQFSFWSRKELETGATVHVFGHDLNTDSVRNAAQNYWNQVKDRIQNAKTADKLQQIAKDIAVETGYYQILIPSSFAGNQVLELGAQKRLPEVAMAILYLNYSFISQNSHLGLGFGIARTATGLHPLIQSFQNVKSTVDAKDMAAASLQQIKETRKSTNQWITEKNKEIDALAKRYRETLVFEEPARHWLEQSQQFHKSMLLFLFVFIFAVGLPFFAIFMMFNGFINGNRFVELIDSFQSISPLGGVAILTLPTIAYLWLLKHLSRLFIQQLSLEVDAKHRHSLAKTYLGLVDYEKTDLSEADRALILNALFRPPPPNNAEEGPPSGIVELIRGAKS